jgi:hypothetical protein
MLLGGLVAGVVVSAASFALPAPGQDQEVYSVYYSNSTYTQEVGVRFHSADNNCQTHRIDWGITTPYRRVITSACAQLNE